MVDEIRKKRPRLKKKKILFHDENAPSHTSQILHEEVEWESEVYFGGLEKSYYLEGIEKLEDRWTYYIELKGEFIKK